MQGNHLPILDAEKEKWEGEGPEGGGGLGGGRFRKGKGERGRRGEAEREGNGEGEEEERRREREERERERRSRLLSLYGQQHAPHDRVLYRGTRSDLLLEPVAIWPASLFLLFFFARLPTLFYFYSF